MTTAPDPKNQPASASRSQISRPWEMRLGVLHLIVLVGFVTGTMTCTFFIGFFAGRQTGYETALNATAANSVKLPITSNGAEEDDEDQAAGDVYAKLDEKKQLEAAGHKSDEAIPDVGGIKTTEDAPLDETLIPAQEPEDAAPSDAQPSNGGKADGGEAAVAKPDSQHDAEAAPESVDGHAVEEIAPLGEDGEDVEVKTLRDILNEKDEVAAKPKDGAEAAEVPAPQKSAAPAAKIDSKAAAASDRKPEIKPQLPSTTGSLPSADASQKPKGQGKGWYAQVAAPKARADAEAIAAKLRASGFATYIETASVRGESYYRVLVGPERDKAHADRLILQLKRERYLSGNPFPRAIN